MNTKILSLAFLLSISPNLWAENIEQSSTHHEATAGGIGLVAGTIIAGPFGAIIGGSMGAMTGHHQTQKETISLQQQKIVTQQQTITELENEISEIIDNLTKSEKNAQSITSNFDLAQQQRIDDLNQFATSYQLDIYFLTNSSDIHPQAQQGLAKLTTLLQRHPQLQANIEAHSDWRGSSDKNCLLAKQRLTQVNNNLTQAGVNPSQLLATNYGEQQNYDTSSWGEPLFYDRRVTISLTYFAN